VVVVTTAIEGLLHPMVMIGTITAEQEAVTEFNNSVAKQAGS
jgi:hypothetical protein